MFDFANPYLLLLLLAIPFFWAIYMLARFSRRRKLKRFGNPAVIAHLMPDASRYKPAIKITLQLLALAAIVFILVRPRYGEKEQTRSVSNLEIVVAFDVSNSMLAASTDDAKSTSRLRRAKMLLEKLIDRLEEDKVGLVVFAGEAKTMMPLTSDFYSAKLLVNDLQPTLIKAQGTSISDALEMSMAAFSKKEDVHRVIILITDAEDHEGQAVETAREAAKKGIQIDVIGVGTSKGARIPLGNGSGSFMVDNDGNEVITAVNEEAAAEIAKAGNGIYVNGANPDALTKLDEALKSLSKEEVRKESYKVSAEQFPIFAWIALILLIVDIIVVERKIGWLKNVDFFTRRRHKNEKPQTKGTSK